MTLFSEKNIAFGLASVGIIVVASYFSNFVKDKLKPANSNGKISFISNCANGLAIINPCVFYSFLKLKLNDTYS